MRTFLLLALCLVSSAAHAVDLRVFSVATQADSAVASVIPATPLCAGEEPQAVVDPSDPHWFAAGPTARLDAQELHANALAPLVSVRIDLGGVVHPFILGTPAGTKMRFSSAGWKPRWPFC